MVSFESRCLLLSHPKKTISTMDQTAKKPSSVTELDGLIFCNTCDMFMTSSTQRSAAPTPVTDGNESKTAAASTKLRYGVKCHICRYFHELRDVTQTPLA